MRRHKSTAKIPVDFHSDTTILLTTQSRVFETLRESTVGYLIALSIEALIVAIIP